MEIEKDFMEENEDVIVKFGLLELEETTSNSLLVLVCILNLTKFLFSQFWYYLVYVFICHKIWNNF